VTWFANRNLAHLILGGVFEKYPSLKACFTEQGSSWVVQELASLDSTILMMEDDESSQHFFGGTDMTQRLSLLPSEYFARNCYLGSSPLRLSESNMRYQIGVDRIMWGNDFPHTEGTYPYALEALRYVLADVPEPEIRAITGGTATEVYDLDPTALAEAAKRIGPTLEQIRTPLNDVPDDSLSTVFVPARVEKKRAALAGRRR
jgi:predicted TIM-barrel fold metal-dependent hydrolase